MYIAYLFNKITGEIYKAYSPEERERILNKNNWIQIYSNEYYRLILAIDYARVNPFYVP